MIQSLIIPLISLSLIAPQTPPPQQTKKSDEFRITYASKGRRSPFVSPADFNKMFDTMGTAERYRALFEGMTRTEILSQLKKDLLDINTMVDKGDLKDAFETTDAIYQTLRVSKVRGLEGITYEYKKVYDTLIGKINLIQAEETFKKLNIVISGIIHAREGAQAILDGSNLVVEGQQYKGITIMKIGKNSIEFNLDGVILVREFTKL